VPLSYDIPERRAVGARMKCWSNRKPVAFANFIFCTLDIRISTPVLVSYSVSSFGAWGDTQDYIQGVSGGIVNILVGGSVD